MSGHGDGWMNMSQSSTARTAASYLSCQLALQLVLLFIQVSVVLLQLGREAVPGIVHLCHIYCLPSTRQVLVIHAPPAVHDVGQGGHQSLGSLSGRPNFLDAGGWFT